MLDEVNESATIAASLWIGASEAKLVDELHEKVKDEKIESSINYVPPEANQVANILAEIDPNLNVDVFCARLENMARLSHIKMTIGSTTVSEPGEYLLEDNPKGGQNEVDTECDEDKGSEDDMSLEDLYEQLQSGEETFDEVFVSAAHADKARGVSAEHLSKVWCISLDAAERTLKVVNQKSLHKNNPALVRNYATNDRMLRYKRIDQYFFMDTFFATKKTGKSALGNTCCQLFVSDNGYICVIPMKSRAEVLLAVKQFVKKVGAPEAIVADPIKEHKSQELRKLLNDVRIPF